MQKLQKKSRLLWTLLLISLVVISCAKQLPPPPEGELYLHDAPKSTALCSKLGAKGPCPALPIADTDKFFMLTPATMKSVLNYIDALVYEIKKPQSAEMKQTAITGLEQLSAELKRVDAELGE